MFFHSAFRDAFWIDIPEICPHCGKDFSPQELSTVLVPNSNFSTKYAATVLCGFCNNPVYLTLYCYPGKTTGRLTASYPAENLLDLPKEISLLFPRFYELYRQSRLAEIKGCTDICGAGFRKALETLVKQYAAKLCPDAEALISKESLSQAIRRIDNPRIKTLASASTWLGNDQTHFVSNHPTYDLADMKVFMKALCYYILMEEEFKRARNLILPEDPR